MNIQRITVETPLFFDSHIREPEGKSEGVVIFLHGFSLTGKKMDQALSAAIPKNWISFSPNALFPISIPTEKPGLKLGYSWYVYDSHLDDYVIEPRFAVEALVRAIRQLGWESLPKKIVGFSQGGYLGPFLAQALTQVMSVVGIGCGYLPDELDPARPLEVHALHGSKDEVISLAGAQADHKKLISLPGFSGTFQVLPDMMHRLDSRLVEPLTKLLSEESRPRS